MSLDFCDIDDVFLPQGRFGHFWWPGSLNDRGVQPPAQGFLLVFHSNHLALKRTVSELMASDRWMDTSFIQCPPALCWWKKQNKK